MVDPGAATGFGAKLIAFYAGPLARIERVAIVVLALVVVAGGLVVLIGPKLGFTHGIDVQTLVYISAFYLCLFGAILATRRSGHIAIDAITPYLNARFRRRLEGVLMFVGAAATAWIAITTWDYVARIVQSDATIIKGSSAAIWSTKLWRWPMGLCFAWIALHFAVNGAVRIMGKLPHELGLAPEPKVNQFDLLDDEPSVPEGGSETGEEGAP